MDVPRPFKRPRRSDDPAVLQRDRWRNDQWLKGKLESIFDKYSKDFAGVGDEIDMETGEIVVDNGHLQGMQEEDGTRTDEGSWLLRAYTTATAHEDDDNTFSYDDRDGSVRSEEGSTKMLSPKACMKRPGLSKHPSRVTRQETDVGTQRSRSEYLDSEDNGDDLLNVDQHQPHLAEPPQLHNKDAVSTSSTQLHDSLKALANSRIPAINQLSDQIAQLISQAFATISGEQQHIEPAWRAPPLPPAAHEPSTQFTLPTELRSSLHSASESRSIWAISNSRPQKQHRRRRDTTGIPIRGAFATSLGATRSGGLPIEGPDGQRGVHASSSRRVRPTDTQQISHRLAIPKRSPFDPDSQGLLAMRASDHDVNPTWSSKRSRIQGWTSLRRPSTLQEQPLEHSVNTKRRDSEALSAREGTYSSAAGELKTKHMEGDCNQPEYCSALEDQHIAEPMPQTEGFNPDRMTPAKTQNALPVHRQSQSNRFPWPLNDPEQRKNPCQYCKRRFKNNHDRKAHEDMRKHTATRSVQQSRDTH